MVAGCSGDSPENRNINIDLTRSESEAVRAVNDFTFDLMRASEKRFSSERPNYVMSPQGIAWCIAMVANGASSESETLREMLDVLKINEGVSLQDVNDYSAKLINAITGEHGGTTIGIANSAFYKNEIGINNTFAKYLRTFYNAELFADASDKQLDNWIEGKTNGLIKDFAKNRNLERLDFGVLNAVCFSGYWENEFDIKNTKDLVFHNSDGSITRHPMMCDTQSVKVFENECCKSLRMPFRNNSFAIYFLIPKEGKRLNEVLDVLDGSEWTSLIKGVDISESSTDIHIPKFEIESEIDFVNILEDMGMERVFTSEAELENLCQKPEFMQYLDQATLLSIDEKGTKAASVSRFSTGPTSALPGTFYLDEPFYYFITEESTGAILFAGKISQL